MALLQLVPSRVKVALGVAANDARHLVRAFREPRLKGARERRAVPPDLEVRFAPTRRTVAPVVQPSVPGDEPGESPVIVFADSGVTLHLQHGETILEAGLRNGVDLLYSCTLGGCGACMLQVREGEVEYEDREAICLTDEEIQDGNCLACVGRPRGRVVLEA